MTADQHARSNVIVVLLLILYLAVALPALAAVPRVHEDEPWIASTGAKIAADGVFGSDPFTGYFGMERHMFVFMPVYPLMLGAAFAFADVGLTQARLVVVALGLATLLVTYVLAGRLFDRPAGTIAVALLLFTRLHATTEYQLTGVLFLDMSRIARYDMAAALFGLLSLYVFVSGAALATGWRMALAGLLGAMSALSNVYGVFWIVSLVLLAWLQHRDRRAVMTVVAGAAVPLAAYAAYVSSAWADWQSQTRWFGPRFDLLNPTFYWQNLLGEAHRYRPGLGDAGWHYVARPALWIMVAAVPAAIIALLRRAAAGDRAASAIAVPSLVIIVGFALLIQSKVANYALTLQPLIMIAVAWGITHAWKCIRGRGVLAVRAAVVLAMALIVVEGSARMTLVRAGIPVTTPYDTAIARVRAHVPAGSRILGLHAYWFGFEDYRYVSWFVPIVRSNRTLFPAGPPLEQALDDVGANVLLIDERMRKYFTQAPASDPVPATIERWMTTRGYRRVASVMDATYGTFEVFDARARAPE